MIKLFFIIEIKSVSTSVLQICCVYICLSCASLIDLLNIHVSIVTNTSQETVCIGYETA